MLKKSLVEIESITLDIDVAIFCHLGWVYTKIQDQENSKIKECY